MSLLTIPKKLNFEGWRIVRLGELIFPDREKIKATEYSGEHKFVKKISFSSGKIVFREKNQTKTDAYKSTKGHLLISNIAFNQGGVAITTETTVATTHYDFYKTTANVDILYLWHYLRSDFFRALFSEEIKYTGYRKEAKYNFIKDLKILLPPLNEQKSIVYILSMLQEDLEVQEQVVNASIGLKISLMRYLFTEGIKHRKLKDTAIGKIPIDWRVENFRNILSRTLRHGVYKRKEDISSSGVRIIKMGDLNSNLKIGDQDMERVRVNENELKRFKVDEGNLIFARTSIIAGGLGNCGIIIKHNDTIIFDGNLLCADLNLNVAYPEFYLYYFKSEQGQKEISGITAGTQSRNISSSNLMEIMIPLPGIKEQIEIANIISKVFEKIRLESKRLTLMKSIFYALSNKLIEGKITTRALEVPENVNRK